MTEPVKPCPFCGTRAISVSADARGVSIECPRCHARTLFCPTEDEAYAAWNHRATGQTEREATEPSEAMLGAMVKAWFDGQGEGQNSDAQFRSRMLRAYRSLASTPPEKKP